MRWSAGADPDSCGGSESTKFRSRRLTRGKYRVEVVLKEKRLDTFANGLFRYYVKICHTEPGLKSGLGPGLSNNIVTSNEPGLNQV